MCPERTCEHCQNRFQPVRRSQRYCSRLCQRRGYQPTQNQARQLAHATDPTAIQKYNRRDLLRRRYGLTIEQYNQMLEAQNGICFICGLPPKPGGVRSASNLHVDHNHETGQVRALLCLNCNRGLGYFKENVRLLEEAIRYLQRYQEVRA